MRIIDEKEYAKAGDERYILVDDALVTYKELAREHRRQFSIPCDWYHRNKRKDDKQRTYLCRIG